MIMWARYPKLTGESIVTNYSKLVIYFVFVLKKSVSFLISFN